MARKQTLDLSRHRRVDARQPCVAQIARIRSAATWTYGMGVMHETIVVVPCFNEEKRLDRDAFVGCLSRDARLRLVLVNDGSVDRTADVLRDLAASAPAQVHILDLTRNSGKAEAVRQGVLRAVELGSE